MTESHIPDYSEYSNVFLVDVYSRIDREGNPKKAEALDNEIRKRFDLTDEETIDPEIVKKFLKVYENKEVKSKRLLSANEEKIRQGWIAGVVLGGLSFFTWLIAMLSAKAVNGVDINAFGFIDILLIFGLSYGIYRKSRFCVTFLTIYYFIVKTIEIVITFPAGVVGIIGLIIFTTFFIRAMMGAFNYHNEQKEKELQVIQQVVQ